MAYAFITKINNIREHTNADRLNIGTCFGNQVIIGKDIKEGQVGLYFATDCQIGEEFAIKNDLIRRKDENGNACGGYLDGKKRNIRSLKLRGEFSDGLFMPLEALKSFGNISKLAEGDCVDIFNGVLIAQKYIPKRNHKQSNGANQSKKRAVKKETIKYPTFFEHVDTKQFAYNKAQFKEGDLINISLKMHGTSARTGFCQQVKTIKPTLLNKLLVKIGLRKKETKEYKTVSGSRRVVLKNFEGGFYSSNEFREKYHNFFDGKLKKGETIYYEIVGWAGEDTLIMGKHNNKKVSDKEFTKKYGKETIFSYGCEKGQNDIFVYRITMTNEDGDVFEYPTWLVKQRCEEMAIKTVPVLESFNFTTLEDLEERVERLSVGEDPIGKTHEREGVVVRIENRPTFTVFKNKGIYFKILEGLAKDNGFMDMEEIEDIKGDEEDNE